MWRMSNAHLLQSGDEPLVCQRHLSISAGAERDLLALQILQDGKVRAKCLATGQAKTFVLAKMRLREDGPETYVPGTLREPRHTHLADVFEVHSEEIRSMGWHPQLEDDDEGDQCLSVHRISRSTGRPLKGSFASLTFKPVQWDLVFTQDGRFERANERPSVKPYTVRAKNASGSPSFKDLDKAADKFLEAVRAVPPETRGSTMKPKK
jgi:hypothetical protein